MVSKGAARGLWGDLQCFLQFSSFGLPCFRIDLSPHARMPVFIALFPHCHLTGLYHRHGLPLWLPRDLGLTTTEKSAQRERLSEQRHRDPRHIGTCCSQGVSVTLWAKMKTSCRISQLSHSWGSHCKLSWKQNWIRFFWHIPHLLY